ncbi:MAG: hypothetical protein HQ596_02250 [Candidatus Saganbacteria bacterium]|nr:hypothetical protein [Candidatus Saganbacteria bacterium]
MNRILAVVILIILGFFLISPLNLDFGHPQLGVSQYYINYGVVDTGASNMVTAIYLNYRAYDTLGEATVFFASALGVFMLLRREEERNSDG